MPSSTTPSSSLSLAAMLAVVLALFASTAAALQFDLDVGRTKCLGEIMGKHEVAKGSYRIDGIPDGSANTGLSVTVSRVGGRGGEGRRRARRKEVFVSSSLLLLRARAGD